MKNIHRAIAAILFTIPLILHPVGALANGPVDPNRIGSIRIAVVDRETDQRVPHNAVISLFKVATPNITSDPLSFDLIGYFADSGVEITTTMTVTQGQAASSILSSIVSANGMQPVASNNLPNGMVSFGNLSQGAYLVVHEFLGDASQGGVFINPYLLTVPMRGIAGGGWVYDVVSYPKFETVQPTPMPTPVPTTTPAPTATPAPTVTPAAPTPGPTDTPGITPGPTSPGITPGPRHPGVTQGPGGPGPGGPGPAVTPGVTPVPTMPGGGGHGGEDPAPTPVIVQPTPDPDPLVTRIPEDQFGDPTPGPDIILEPTPVFNITPTPTPLSYPFLPQTGLNRMPVIILSVLGFAFILIGVLDLRRRKRGKA